MQRICAQRQSIAVNYVGITVKIKMPILTICFLTIIASSAYSQNNYAILMQETPPGAGKITPGMGVHDFDEGSKVTLTTVANNGYHFVFWLGDVSDPTVNRTTLSVDGPKIIIAVFERDSHEFTASINRVSNGPSALIPRYDSTGGSGFSGGGGATPSPPPIIPDPPPDPPTPEPVPEPATVAIMATGGYFSLRRRKLKRKGHTSH